MSSAEASPRRRHRTHDAARATASTITVDRAAIASRSHRANENHSQHARVRITPMANRAPDARRAGRRRPTCACTTAPPSRWRRRRSASLRGSAVALVGSNGSGKTTLLSTIAGLVRPPAGTIRVERHDRHGDAVAAPPPVDAAHRRRGVADGSLSGARPDRPRCGADDKAAIAEAAEMLEVPHLRRRPFGELSGGQQPACARRPGGRRQPDILLLDEPVTGSRPAQPAPDPRGDRRARRARRRGRVLDPPPGRGTPRRPRAC